MDPVLFHTFFLGGSNPQWSLSMCPLHRRVDKHTGQAASSVHPVKAETGINNIYGCMQHCTASSAATACGITIPCSLANCDKLYTYAADGAHDTAKLFQCSAKSGKGNSLTTEH